MGKRWLLCKFGISPNGYYNFLKDRKADYRKKKVAVMLKIAEIYHGVNGVPGYRMMSDLLTPFGYRYSIATHYNADFSLGDNNPNLKIRYTQVNFVKEPVRITLIDSSMLGLPFEGYYSYKDGVGSMKGVVAKLVTVFDQRGAEMNKASLVTVLSESLFCPNIALQDYIKWEAVDDTHAKATISYYGISASGEFTFSENGEMLSFKTNYRYVTDGTTKAVNIPWSCVLGDYKEIDGIKSPTTFKAIWHYESRDKIYFDGKYTRVEYFG